jgi:C1A family cysteine protease
LADEFDWQAYAGDSNLPAGNYVTPVRDQVVSGPCWAFAAVGTIEARWAITNKQSNPTIALSEQNLICAGSDQGFGNMSGGWEYLGLGYVYSTGIVDAATMPYNQTNTAPNWPLTAPYTLYKISADWTLLNNSTVAPVKTALEQGGPLLAEMNSSTDWYTPPDLTGYSFSATGDQTGGIDHAVVITGFTDDPTAPGGGYWHVKNSHGTDWGQDGYGYVDYLVMEQSDHHIFEDDGSVYTVAVPEPLTLSLLGFGCLALLGRRRRASM